MIIHVRHAERERGHPESLLFRFEAASFLDRLIRRPDEAPDGQPLGMFYAPKGDHVFAQLRPASGDTFFFMLQEAVRSGITLVISPLTSLVRDPETRLQVHPQKGRSGHLVYTDITVGKIRLMYISPESLITREFREDLFAVIDGKIVNALLIDKAHCVSEWGGAFRPAYLRIPQVMTDLVRRYPKITIIGLTAISGTRVRRDILSVLNLRDISLRDRRDVYDRRACFQAVRVGDPEEKRAAYDRLRREVIPAFLARENLAGIFPPLPDIPEEASPAKAIPEGPEAPACADIRVSTRPGQAVRNALRVRVETGLAGSVSGWLYQALRDVRSGGRALSVRIVDLPSAACEADMASRFSRVPACRDNVCAFGRKTLCDYGIRHHRILKNTPDAADDLMAAWKLIDGMIAHFRPGDKMTRIPIARIDPRDVETALYRLAVLGVIDIFFTDPRDGPPGFKVYGFTPFVGEDRCRAGVIRYLARHDSSMTQSVAGGGLREGGAPNGFFDRMAFRFARRLDSLEAEARVALDSFASHRAIYRLTARYLPPLFFFVHDEIRRMAYRRLWNLKEFIKSDGCRYEAAIRTVRTIRDGWRCGDCDTCRSRPEFSGPGKTDPGAPVWDDAGEADLKIWLQNDSHPIEPAEADRLIQAHPWAAAGLFHRALHILEDDPRNLKALYLACEVSPEAQKTLHAVELMTIANQDLNWPQVIRLFETIRSDRRAVFDVLDDAFGATVAPEAAHWLYRMAADLGLSDGRVEALARRMAAGAFSRVDWHALASHLIRRSTEVAGEPAFRS